MCASTFERRRSPRCGGDGAASCKVELNGQESSCEFNVGILTSASRARVPRKQCGQRVATPAAALKAALREWSRFVVLTKKEVRFRKAEPVFSSKVQKAF